VSITASNFWAVGPQIGSAIGTTAIFSFGSPGTSTD
jgi:hypothetical protein